MSSGHYCDNCHLNRNTCACSDPKPEKPTPPVGRVKHETDFLNGWRETIQRVFPSKATESKMVLPEHRYQNPVIVDLSNTGHDLSGMPEQPLKYGWNCVKRFPPPSGKLQFYTIGGTCIHGSFSSIAAGFVTDWSYLLPSPSKQKGNIK